MNVKVALYVFFLSTVVAFSASPVSAKNKSNFKTKRVTLYDTGIAELMLTAEVSGSSQLEIPVQTAHLDDMLATLYFSTSGSVRIRSLNYPTVENMGQALHGSGIGQSLSSEDEGKVVLPSSLSAFAAALVGSEVKLYRKSGPSVSGIVTACTDNDSAVALPIDENDADSAEAEKKNPHIEKVLVVADAKGAMTFVPLKEIVRVEPLSARESAAVRNFAVQLGKTNGFYRTAVRLSTAPESRGSLTARFVRQIPVWRMTYKIVASQGGDLSVEAWALVHNDTEEDWNEVDITLVSGLPASYVFSIASPRYGERAGLELDAALQMMPQLGAKTPDSLLYDFITLGTSYIGTYGHGGGAGYGYGSLGVGGKAVSTLPSQDAASSQIRFEETAADPIADAAVEAEISTYTALTKVSIPAGTSGMVPVMIRSLNGTPFTLIGEDEKASTCVKTVNQTGLVLQQGIAGFYINGRFRGQTELFRTEPNEHRLLCFGEDPDIQFTTNEKTAYEYKSLEWKSDRLVAHSIKRTDFVYEIENMSGDTRQAALEISHMQNGRVVRPLGTVRADEETHRLFYFSAAPKASISQTVVVEEGVARHMEITNESLSALIASTTLKSEHKSVLMKILAAMDEKKRAAAKQAEIEASLKKTGTMLERKKSLLNTVPAVRHRKRIMGDMLKEIMTLENEIPKLEQAREQWTGAAAAANTTITAAWKTLVISPNEP